MMNYNKFRRTLRVVAIAVAVGLWGSAGCLTSDDTLGSEFLPENQELATRTLRLANAERFFETRLYQTDSIVSSNLETGYFGVQRNDTTGLTEAGFVSQYLNYFRLDSGYFGYRPIFDSARIILSITSYGLDTITPQTFNVYEVTDNSYLTSSDSVFYLSFDPKAYIDTEPLFTFTFPDGISTGPATKIVRMIPTDKGREFVARLMISDGTKYAQDGVWYSIYQDYDKFVETFKGLCIRPKNPEATAMGKGTVFGTKLSASGFSIHGRNRLESDPTLINDTIASYYYFYDSEIAKISTAGNQSVNFIRHDYTGTGIQLQDVTESNPDRPESKEIIVSGMGGVVSELTFTQEFFDGIEREITKANAELDENFSTLAFNRALLTIYFTGSDYDWQKINQNTVIPLMSVAISRLGSYTNYKNLTGIPDYDYLTEWSTQQQNSAYVLPYGGYINRSQACYALDISGYIQVLWNRYLDAKKTAPDGKVDLTKITRRSIFLAPDANSLYTTTFCKVQGMAAEGNNAPVKMDMTYTLIK